jgi:hypothetical protein
MLSSTALSMDGTESSDEFSLHLSPSAESSDEFSLHLSPSQSEESVCLTPVCDSNETADMTTRHEFTPSILPQEVLAFQQKVSNMFLLNLRFRGPCIIMYSYNKTNEMH